MLEELGQSLGSNLSLGSWVLLVVCTIVGMTIGGVPMMVYVAPLLEKTWLAKWDLWVAAAVGVVFSAALFFVVVAVFRRFSK